MSKRNWIFCPFLKSKCQKHMPLELLKSCFLISLTRHILYLKDVTLKLNRGTIGHYGSLSLREVERAEVLPEFWKPQMIKENL